MKYYIYRGSKKLSGFYPNDIPGVFAFRKNDCYCFNTWSEANDFIKRVKEAVSDPANIARYGEKYAKAHLSIANNIHIKGVLV